MCYLYAMKLNEILNQALNSQDDESKVLHDFYVKELSEILEAKSMLQAKEDEIREKIARYGNNQSIPPPDKNKGSLNYPKGGSWKDKIDYVLLQKRDLSGKEVIAMIEDIQPELKGKIASSIYPTLSDNSKENKHYTKRLDEKLKINKFSLTIKK